MRNLLLDSGGGEARLHLVISMPQERLCPRALASYAYRGIWMIFHIVKMWDRNGDV